MTADHDPELDSALARLPEMDFPPLAVRTLRVAALRRLEREVRPLSAFERWEPAFLAAFATAHLVWVVLHVLAGSGASY